MTAPSGRQAHLRGRTAVEQATQGEYRPLGRPVSLVSRPKCRFKGNGRECTGRGAIHKDTGKLRLSVGKKESFRLEDLKDFSTWTKIQEFHEVQIK
jgi:hypothetical protein